MACIHFQVAEVSKRRTKSFGTFSVHQTDIGISEPLFNGLSNPFYVADFRDWQVIKPDLDRLDEMGAEILSLEKIRPHIQLERAVMAIRFSNEFFGTQFHPEADADGMLLHFLEPERRQVIVQDYGEKKYLEMIEHLRDADKIELTNNIILPLFLSQAIRAVRPEPVMAWKIGTGDLLLVIW